MQINLQKWSHKLMTNEQAKQILNNIGLRQTSDRRALLQLFKEQRAWTVAQLHTRLSKADLSTVYRNVSLLATKGLVHLIEVCGKKAYYEPTDREHHAHEICRRCGLALCVPCPIDGQSADHALEFYSNCRTCADI
jgi:Fe2+ or Zn2+ uptake regulation protein